MYYNEKVELVKNYFNLVIQFISDFFQSVYFTSLENANILLNIDFDSRFYTFLGINLIFVSLWVLFFRYNSNQKSIRFSFLLKAFLVGLLTAFIAFIIERLLLSISLTDFHQISSSIFLNVKFFESTNWTFLTLFFQAFFFIAFIEEGIRYLFLRRLIKNRNVDQIADGIKAGIGIGLGFGFLENYIYFLNFLGSSAGDSLLMSFLTGRGLISMLGHALFGAIMGYYLILSKIRNERSLHFKVIFDQHNVPTGVPQDVKPVYPGKAFLVALLLHGSFNFLLFIKLGIVSVILITIFLFAITIIYSNMKNFRLYYDEGSDFLEFPPDIAKEAEKVIESRKFDEKTKRTWILSLFSKTRNDK